MTQQEALYKYCLRLGDNALIQSYRLSEWCSNAPLLEEDLALTNFALDMTGRAAALLTYAGAIEGKGRTDDDLAYKRSERNFYNDLITELPNGDFAYTMAKQLAISAFECFFYAELMKSSDPTLAAIAAKTIKEVKYHLARARDWVVRLGDGTNESHEKMQKAIDSIWAYTGELFECDETDAMLVGKGIAVDVAPIRPEWQKYMADSLSEATLAVPNDDYMQTGSRTGVHTEHLGHILTEMQYLQRAYPEATW
jgi:ring-1,2-phenylacetyl-CoA epoxidase subunit PaaC